MAKHVPYNHEEEFPFKLCPAKYVFTDLHILHMIFPSGQLPMTYFRWAGCGARCPISAGGDPQSVDLLPNFPLSAASFDHKVSAPITRTQRANIHARK